MYIDCKWLHARPSSTVWIDPQTTPHLHSHNSTWAVELFSGGKTQVITVYNSEKYIVCTVLQENTRLTERHEGYGNEECLQCITNCIMRVEL